MQIANAHLESRYIIPTYFAGLGFMLQVILCQINIFGHQLSQNMTTVLSDLRRFAQIQNLQNLCFELQNN